MRVVSFNLMAPAGPFFPWGNRPRRAAKLLGELDADLIGTQEGTPESLAELVEGLPQFTLLGRGRGPGGEGTQCALLFRRERFQALGSGHFWMSAQPDSPGILPGRDLDRFREPVMDERALQPLPAPPAGPAAPGAAAHTPAAVAGHGRLQRDLVARVEQRASAGKGADRQGARRYLAGGSAYRPHSGQCGAGVRALVGSADL